MNNKQRKLINHNYELAGNSLLRQLNHWRRTRQSIMGYYGGGPSLRNLGVMLVYHYLGKPIFRLHGWYQHQHRLKALLSRYLPHREK